MVCCLAVEPEQQFVGQTNRRDAFSSIDRWDELYKQIFDDYPTRSISSSQLKDTLDEMSRIEQTEAYRSKLKSFIGFKGYRSLHYRELVEQCYNANILIERDATITNLLLQTFDFHSNDCNKIYFEHLNEIYKTFEYKPIAKALEENRDLQYENCWHRLINQVISASMVLGSRIKEPLNKLVTIIYPDSDVILPSTINKNDSRHNTESVRISRNIAQFLHAEAIKNCPEMVLDNNHAQDFEHFIINPCKSLIKATSNAMAAIYEMLEMTTKSGELINPIQTKILNRFMMCQRIVINDRDFIMFNVNEYMKILDLQTDSSEKFKEIQQRSSIPYQQTMIPIQNLLDSGRKQIERSAKIDISTELTLATRSRSPEPDVELITQHSLINENEPISDEELHQFGVKRRKTTTDAVLDDGPQPVRPVGQNHIVVRVDKSFGKGPLVKYQTVWLDGTVTEESRVYLQENWPHILKEFERKRKAENQARYSFRKKAKSRSTKPTKKPFIPLSDSHFYGTPSLAQIDPNMQRPHDPSRSVVRIEQGIPRYSGKFTMYPTIWSDGTRSLELRDYLAQNWSEAWDQLFQATRAENVAKFESKQTGKDKQS